MTFELPASMPLWSPSCYPSTTRPTSGSSGGLGSAVPWPHLSRSAAIVCA